MKERLSKLAHSIDRLSLRERLFLFAAGILIVAGLWEATLAGPLAVRETIGNEQVKSLQARLQTLDESLSAAVAGMSEGMPGQLDQLRALRERVAETDEEIRAFTSDLVDPKEMRLVLEELLQRQAGLTLVSAVNLAARPVIEDDVQAQDDAAAANERAIAAPRLYRHSFVLTLRGSYLDCLAYLKAVERLPWRLYWSRLTLGAEGYPNNDIEIELTTLSLDEEWIGV